MTGIERTSRIALPLAAALCLQACASGPDDAGMAAVEADPEAARIEALAERLRAPGNEGNVLFWSTEDRRIAFANIEHIYPTRRVRASETPYPLPAAPRDLSQVTYAVEGVEYSLQDYLDLPDSIGMIVVQDGQVLFEDYAEGHGAETPWMSFSVTKSITSLLVGAAIRDGYIGGIDDPVTDYLPRLKGSAYEGVTLADVLQMASGVAWNEDYRDADSDVSRAGAANGVTLYDYMGQLPRAAPPGSAFNYNTGETNLVGAVLRAAIGNNASAYLESNIWRPFGMEHDAHWVVTQDSGAELGGCCLNATLRDYARIGLFAMANGVLPDGTPVLPDDWMARSTTPSSAQPGYGYLWWLGPDAVYSARGIFGQTLFVDPEQGLVIALHGNAERAAGSGYGMHIRGITTGIRQALAH